MGNAPGAVCGSGPGPGRGAGLRKCDLLAFGGDRDPPLLRAGPPGVAPPVVGSLDLVPEIARPGLMNRVGASIGLIVQVGPCGSCARRSGTNSALSVTQIVSGMYRCRATAVNASAQAGGSSPFSVNRLSRFWDSASGSIICCHHPARRHPAHRHRVGRRRLSSHLLRHPWVAVCPSATRHRSGVPDRVCPRGDPI